MVPSIRTRGRHFIDPEGRTIWLRGANVGAASKVPSCVPTPSMYPCGEQSDGWNFFASSLAGPEQVRDG